MTILNPNGQVVQRAADGDGSCERSWSKFIDLSSFRSTPEGERMCGRLTRTSSREYTMYIPPKSHNLHLRLGQNNVYIFPGVGIRFAQISTHPAVSFI